MNVDLPNKTHRVIKQTSGTQLELRAGEWPGNTAKVGDTIRWRNPNTQVVYENLEVEFSYRTTSGLLVRGFVGRNVQGRDIVQSVTVKMFDCAVTKRGVR